MGCLVSYLQLAILARQRRGAEHSKGWRLSAGSQLLSRAQSLWNLCDEHRHRCEMFLLVTVPRSEGSGVRVEESRTSVLPAKLALRTSTYLEG